MSELERDYTLDVPEQSTLQQALDSRLGAGRLTRGRVLRNASVQDLSSVLQAAWLHDAQVVVRDLAHLPEGALGVDLSGLSQVTEIDVVSGLCTIERSVSASALLPVLEAEGLWLESGHFGNPEESIGIALERGEGAALVVSLRAVLADGTAFTTPLAPRRATGSNPDSALIGAQGKTGVVTHATLRVRPLPDWSQALEAIGPTAAILEAARQLLREHRPAWASVESHSATEARLVVVPGAAGLPSGALEHISAVAASQPSAPAPPLGEPRRVGWRALAAAFESGNCWAGPLDMHGGCVRGPVWSAPSSSSRIGRVRRALDPAEVLV